MYARFLGEAAAITGEPRLAGMGTELTAIGDRWEEVAAAFALAAQADDPADLLTAAIRADERHRRPGAGLLAAPRHGEALVLIKRTTVR